MARRMKKDEYYPCVLHFPRDGEELRFEDVAPEELDQKYILFEDMTEEQKAAHKAKREKRVSEGLNRHFEERPDLYHRFCQSEVAKKYDREHGYITE